MGANIGQYAESVLSRYNCEVISFEPLEKEFLTIMDKVGNYKSWSAYNYALGETNGILHINVSKNSFSSSILPVKQETLQYNQGIGYVDTQQIEVRKLDDVWGLLNIDQKNVLLKIDTQGYEGKVINDSRREERYVKD